MPAALCRLLARRGHFGALFAVLALLTCAGTAEAQTVVPTTPSDPYVGAFPVSDFYAVGIAPSPDDPIVHENLCASNVPTTDGARTRCIIEARYFSTTQRAIRRQTLLLELATRRLGLLAGQGTETRQVSGTVNLAGYSLDALKPRDQISLTPASIDALAEALADRPSSGGEGIPEDPLDDPRFRMLFGLMVGLWVMTRIFRQVVPGG